MDTDCLELISLNNNPRLKFNEINVYTTNSITSTLLGNKIRNILS